MSLLFAAVSVTILSTGSDNPPELRVVNQGFYSSSAACEQWRRDVGGSQSHVVDPATSKMVVATYYSCNPINPDNLVKAIQNPAK